MFVCCHEYERLPCIRAVLVFGLSTPGFDSESRSSSVSGWGPQNGGGGGPMKGFIFKSMRWYRMHEAVEIHFLHNLIKDCKIENGCVLRLSCIFWGYLIIMDFLICVLSWFMYDVSLFLWPIGIMIYFNLGCPFVSEWTCAPPMIGFIVLFSTVNFDVKRGGCGKWFTSSFIEIVILFFWWLDIS